MCLILLYCGMLEYFFNKFHFLHVAPVIFIISLIILKLLLSCNPILNTSTNCTDYNLCNTPKHVLYGLENMYNYYGNHFYTAQVKAIGGMWNLSYTSYSYILNVINTYFHIDITLETKCNTFLYSNINSCNGFVKS